MFCTKELAKSSGQGLWPNGHGSKANEFPPLDEEKCRACKGKCTQKFYGSDVSKCYTGCPKKKLQCVKHAMTLHSRHQNCSMIAHFKACKKNLEIGLNNLRFAY